VFAGLRLLGLFGLLLVIAGCLRTTEEIFGPDAATLVPGIEGNYAPKDGNAQDVLTIELIPGTRDYAYFDPKNREKDRGRMRGVAVGNDLYFLQMRADDWPPRSYWQVLLKVVRQNGAVTGVVVMWAEDDAIAALAARSGVEIGAPGEGSDSGPQTLKGSREAVAAFLKKVPTLPLREVTAYVRS